MENVRIQDDLYTFVNQKTLDALVIPDDMPVAGGFAELSQDVEKLMINEFVELTKSGVYPNIHMERACKLFAAVQNTKKRSAHGITPALKYLAPVAKLTDVKSLNRQLAKFVLAGLPLPVRISVETDMKDTLNHCVMIQGPDCILPDVNYYKPEMEQQKAAFIGMWSQMTAQILAQTKLTAEEQQQYLADTLAFDAIIATLVKSQEEWSEYTKMYNPMKTSKVNKMLKPLEFRKMLKGLFGEVPERIIVTEPRYFENFNTLFNEENFELYKHWAYVTFLVGSCSLLSEKLRDLGGSYRRALSGIKAMSSVQKYAYQLASGYYSEPVGLYYGEKYFGHEAKKDIIEIVHQIIDTYKERIQNNDFLQPQTKEKAILKLSTMGVKMGFPDDIRPIYNELDFDETKSLFDIVTSIRKKLYANRLSKLNKPVDRTEWAMPGHMVNACYDPTVNDITFPAGILQAPFYSIKQTRSENLGGIGAVIGHEISHAFDSNGAKCDENGNLNNWWTKQDTRLFNAKIKAMIKQFDGIELPWGKVNGKFIVSENIADNGGMAVTLHIMSKMDDPNYQEYFYNWARVWCQKAKPEYRQLLLQVDVHGPAILRANITPRNFPEWYTAFGVTSKDKMYIAPNKRVVIW